MRKNWLVNDFLGLGVQVAKTTPSPGRRRFRTIQQQSVQQQIAKLRMTTTYITRKDCNDRGGLFVTMTTDTLQDPGYKPTVTPHGTLNPFLQEEVCCVEMVDEEGNKSAECSKLTD
jgi:hypothetical protein